MARKRLSARRKRTLGDTLQRIAAIDPKFVKAVQIAAEHELKRIVRKKH